MSSLSDSALAQLCEASADYLRGEASSPEFRRNMCIFQALALGLATTPESCETFVTQCLDAPDMSETNCSDVEPMPECDATVGELERCAVDQFDVLSAAVAGLDCSLAGSPELEEELEGRMLDEQPASCAPITSDPGCSSMDEMTGG